MQDASALVSTVEQGGAREVMTRCLRTDPTCPTYTLRHIHYAGVSGSLRAYAEVGLQVTRICGLPVGARTEVAKERSERERDNERRGS
jgi:hypothetical protein